MTLHEILDRLAAKPSGDRRWTACCPAHDDQNPSLSIAESDDGKILLHCFAGCEYSAIVDALGENGTHDNQLAMPNREMFPVITYDYRDEIGTLLYQVVRYEPKAFRQRRPDGNGGWRWNLGDVRRVLYRLPEVLAAVKEDKPVWLVEGEKDCDNLRRFGLAATTSPGGASKWRNEYNESLRGAQVILIPDNDKPGRRHTGMVASSLNGIAASIKMATLPEDFRGDKIKDVSDFLRAGGTLEELQALVTSIEIPDEAPTQKPLAESLTDMGNARRLVGRHGQDMRYCHVWSKWLCWNGKFWEPDETGQMMRWAKQTVRAFSNDPGLTEDAADWAAQSEMSARLEAMLKVARSEIEVAVRPEQFDAYHWLLNCRNGTLDLKTGTLREHRREDYITKFTDVQFDPNAQCPQWLAFLNDIMAGNAALVDYLQQVIGYSLTGDTREQCVFILYGTGANGKSTMLDIVGTLLGNYACQVPTDTLMSRKPGSATNDLARLRGMRISTAIETEEDRKLAEALVKQMTGSDSIAARFLYAEYFDFKPTHKIFLAANHKPVIRGTDHAIWRRIHLIPFTVTIPAEKQDKQLAAKLKAELPGILNWAVEGCLKWQQTGRLERPPEVSAATNSYRAEMDVVARFVEDRCIELPDAAVNATMLYTDYKSWCEATGEYALTQRKFGERLKERGFDNSQRDRVTGRVLWRGIGLREEGEGEVA